MSSLSERDVVTWVHEYLHSRGLHGAAVALERETGVSLSPPELRPLQDAILDGRYGGQLWFPSPFIDPPHPNGAAGLPPRRC